MGQIKDFCQDNQYKDIEDMTCKQCREDCVQCTSQIYCLNCSFSFDYLMSNCLSSTQECEGGFYLNQLKKKCIECKTQFCEKCSPETEECTQCQSNFELKNIGGIQYCILNESIAQDRYTSYNGQQGYKLIDTCEIGTNQNILSKQCEQINQCQKDELKYQYFYFKNGIINFVSFSDSLTIIANQYQVIAFNKKDLNFEFQVVDFEFLNSKERIKSIINIDQSISIFTNFQLFVYNPLNHQILSKISLLQGNNTSPLSILQVSYEKDQSLLLLISCDDQLKNLFFYQFLYKIDSSTNEYKVSLESMKIIYKFIIEIVSFKYFSENKSLVVTDKYQIYVFKLKSQSQFEQSYVISLDFGDIIKQPDIINSYIGQSEVVVIVRNQNLQIILFSPENPEQIIQKQIIEQNTYKIDMTQQGNNIYVFIYKNDSTISICDIRYYSEENNLFKKTQIKSTFRLDKESNQSSLFSKEGEEYKIKYFLLSQNGLLTCYDLSDFENPSAYFTISLNSQYISYFYQDFTNNKQEQFIYITNGQEILKLDLNNKTYIISKSYISNQKTEYGISQIFIIEDWNQGYFYLVAEKQASYNYEIKKFDINGRLIKSLSIAYQTDDDNNNKILIGESSFFDEENSILVIVKLNGIDIVDSKELSVIENISFIRLIDIQKKNYFLVLSDIIDLSVCYYSIFQYANGQFKQIDNHLIQPTSSDINQIQFRVLNEGQITKTFAILYYNVQNNSFLLSYLKEGSFIVQNYELFLEKYKDFYIISETKVLFLSLDLNQQQLNYLTIEFLENQIVEESSLPFPIQNNIPMMQFTPQDCILIEKYNLVICFGDYFNSEMYDLLMMDFCVHLQNLFTQEIMYSFCDGQFSRGLHSYQSHFIDLELNNIIVYLKHQETIDKKNKVYRYTYSAIYIYLQEWEGNQYAIVSKIDLQSVFESENIAKPLSHHSLFQNIINKSNQGFQYIINQNSQQSYIQIDSVQKIINNTAQQSYSLISASELIGKLYYFQDNNVYTNPISLTIKKLGGVFSSQIDKKQSLQFQIVNQNTIVVSTLDTDEIITQIDINYQGSFQGLVWNEEFQQIILIYDETILKYKLFLNNLEFVSTTTISIPIYGSFVKNLRDSQLVIISYGTLYDYNADKIVFISQSIIDENQYSYNQKFLFYREYLNSNVLVIKVYDIILQQLNEISFDKIPKVIQPILMLKTAKIDFILGELHLLVVWEPPNGCYILDVINLVIIYQFTQAEHSQENFACIFHRETSSFIIQQSLALYVYRYPKIYSQQEYFLKVNQIIEEFYLNHLDHYLCISASKLIDLDSGEIKLIEFPMMNYFKFVAIDDWKEKNIIIYKNFIYQINNEISLLLNRDLSNPLIDSYQYYTKDLENNYLYYYSNSGLSIYQIDLSNLYQNSLSDDNEFNNLQQPLIKSLNSQINKFLGSNSYIIIHNKFDNSIHYQFFNLTTKSILQIQKFVPNNYDSSFFSSIFSLDSYNPDTYAFFTSCKILIFNMIESIQEFDLGAFNCQIQAQQKYNFPQLELNKQGGQSGYLYFIQNNLIIKMLQYDLNQQQFKISLVENLTQLESNCSIIEFKSYILNNEDSLSIISYLQDNLVKIMITKQNKQIVHSFQQEFASDVQFIKIINLIQILDQTLLVLNINTSIKISDIFLDELDQLQVREIYSKEILSGEIHQIEVYQHRVNTIFFYMTTKYRIHLIQGQYDQSQKIFQFTLLNYASKHTRFWHKLKILPKLQLICVLSEQQINIYSLSLKFITRISEPQFKYLTDIQECKHQNESNQQQKNILFLVDSAHIYVFNLRVQQKRNKNKLMLQQQVNVQAYPSIGYIEDITPQLSFDHSIFLIYGFNQIGVFQQKLIYHFNFEPLKQQFNSTLNNQCLFQLENYEEIWQQRQQILQFIHKGYVNYLLEITQDQQIMLPSQLEFSNLDKQVEINIDINLNNKSIKNFIQQPSTKDNNNLSVKQFKMIDGILDIQNQFTFENQELMIFKNVTFNFNENSHLIFTNISQIFFQDIKITQLLALKPQQSLISISNVTKLNLSNIQLNNFQLFNQSLFSIENVNSTILNRLKINNSLFVDPIFLFLKNNDDLRAAEMNITDCQMNNFITLTNSKYVSIQQLKVEMINRKSSRQLQNFDQNLTINTNSFIVAQLIQDQLILQDIEASDIYNLDGFLLVKDWYVEKQQLTTQNTNEQEDLELKFSSIEQKLNETNVKMVNSQFNKYFQQIECNKAYFQNISFMNNTNILTNLTNQKNGSTINKLIAINNTLFDSQIILTQSNSIQWSNIQFKDNIIVSQKNQICGMLLKESINIDLQLFTASNNKQTSHLLCIEDLDQSEKIDSIRYNQEYHFNKLTIENNYQGGIKLKNLIKIIIKNSNITSNHGANKGGGVSATDVQSIILQDCILFNNSANLYGGAVYLEDSDLKLQKSKIYLNQAQIGGGINYQNSIVFPSFINQLDLKQQIYDNLAIIYGQNYGSFPTKINMISQLDDIVSSSNQYKTNIEFQIIDEEANVINLPSLINSDDSLLDEILSLYNYEIVSYEDIYVQQQATPSTYNEQNSTFIFSKYIMNSGYQQIMQKIQQHQSVLTQEQKRKLTIKSSDKFYIPDYLNKLINHEYLSVSFHLTFRKCLKGEIIQQFQGINFYECKTCDQNTYSLEDPYNQDQSQLVCKECPQNTVSCNGNVITPLQGYWHFQNSEEILQCFNNKNNCINNSELSIDGCTEGATGPLCESCDYEGKIWNKGDLKNNQYVKIGKFSCGVCFQTLDSLSIARFYAIPILIQLFLILYLFCQILYSQRKIRIKIKAIILLKMNIIHIRKQILKKNHMTAFIRIFFTYIQVLSIAQNFNISFKFISNSKKSTQDEEENGYFIQYFALVGDMLQSTKYLTDCFYLSPQILGFSAKDLPPMVYVRLIQSVIINILFYILALAAIYLVTYKIIKCKTKYTQSQLKRRKNLIISGAIQFFFTFYPSVLQQCLGALSCRKIGNDKNHPNYYIYADVQFECFDYYYYLFNGLISIPIIILITLVIPYIIYSKMKKRKKNLLDINLYLSYGFMFSGYRNETFYWEFIKQYMKNLIFLIFNLLNFSTLLSTVVVSMVIIIYIRYSNYIKPYESHQLNSLDGISQMTILVMLFLIIINEQSQDQFISIFTGTAIIISNLYFLSCSLIYLSTLFLPQKIRRIECLIFYLNKLIQFEGNGLFQKSQTNSRRLTKNIHKIQKFIMSTTIVRNNFQNILKSYQKKQTAYSQNVNAVVSTNFLLNENNTQITTLNQMKDTGIKNNRYSKSREEIDTPTIIHHNQFFLLKSNDYKQYPIKEINTDKDYELVSIEIQSLEEDLNRNNVLNQEDIFKQLANLNVKQ